MRIPLGLMLLPPSSNTRIHPDSPLTIHGNSFPGLDHTYSDATAGTLTQVSWSIGSAELNEYPPSAPNDGAWVQQQAIEALPPTIPS